MWSSAMASSSPVVMPGATASRTSARVSPTTTPARRMTAISSRDLISSLRSNIELPSRSGRRGGRRRHGLERLDEPLGDPFDRPLGGYGDQQLELVVEPDQRGRVTCVDRQPGAHRLGQVVVTLEELARTYVA